MIDTDIMVTEVGAMAPPSPWSICWCGNRYVPSRSSKGECGDVVRHAQQQDGVRIQTALRCVYCSRIVPDVHRKSGRRVRNDRKYCSDSCRVLASKHRKERLQPDGRELTDIAEGGLRT
jgi:hypothetical protein